MYILPTFLSDTIDQDDPVSFGMSLRSSPSEALGRVQDVLSEYWELVTTRDSPVDWSCEREYTDTAEPPTALSTALSLTTGGQLPQSPERFPGKGIKQRITLLSNIIIQYGNLAK